MLFKRLLAGVGVAALALSLTACGTSSEKAAGGADGKVTIYTTTNVWGSVAKHVGGDLVTVESGVTNPDQDPHDYEATAQDKLKVSKAKIVVVNGGGYDEWGNKLAESVDPKPVIVDAVKVSGLEGAEEAGHDHEHADGDHAEGDHDHGHDHGDGDHDHADGGHHHHHGDFNEHVFYSLKTVVKVSEAVRDELSKVDSANAETYKKNQADFAAKIADLQKKADEVKGKIQHVHAVATEPVAGYLLADMGVHDVTPPEFVEQSETEAGPSAQVMAETEKLITSGEAKLLVLNGQTQDATSDKLKADAKTAGIPTVDVTETFPQGTDDYVKWMGTNIDNFSKALVK